MTEELVDWGHGHVYPRKDGTRARCGGPGICPECSKDKIKKEKNIMKTLDEYNKEYMERQKEIEEFNKRTGISCPSCKNELYFEDNTILCSNPPQKWVKCPDCGYKGLIYV